jgi:glycosyltransferase involved in cell wall biosynthesis
VDTHRFAPGQERGDFYVTVSRLVPYKKVGLLAEAFSRLGRPLVIIGEGPERRAIERRAGPTVKMLGWQPDAVVAAHLERCRAFVFAADEDFGIAPVEALAAGAPVIAYGKGGVTETVVPGETGMFFERQDVESIARAVLEFERTHDRFHAAHMRQTAAPYGRERFQREFDDLIQREWGHFKRDQGYAPPAGGELPSARGRTA